MQKIFKNFFPSDESPIYSNDIGKLIYVTILESGVNVAISNLSEPQKYHLVNHQSSPTDELGISSCF